MTLTAHFHVPRYHSSENNIDLTNVRAFITLLSNYMMTSLHYKKRKKKKDLQFKDFDDLELLCQKFIVTTTHKV